jgi:putative Holliday junction resolvase
MIYFDIIQFKDCLKPDYRLLGLDVGQVRIGCALSDPRRILASPYTMFDLKKQKFTLAQLSAIIEKEQAYGIAVGYPLQMNGEAGKACEMVNKFIKKYLLPLNQPIFMQDERLSTSAVNRFFKEMELTRKQQAAIGDKAAASYILQMALDKL